MINVNLTLSADLLSAVDAARGDVPRVRWIRGAIERALPPVEVEYDLSRVVVPGGDVVAERTSEVLAQQIELNRRPLSRGSVRRDVTPFPRKS